MRVSYANKPLNYLLTNVSQLCMYEWVMHYYRYYSNHRAKFLSKTSASCFSSSSHKVHNTCIVVNVHFLSQVQYMHCVDCVQYSVISAASIICFLLAHYINHTIYS